MGGYFMLAYHLVYLVSIAISQSKFNMFSWFILELFRELTQALGSGISLNIWTYLDWIRILLQLYYFCQIQFQMVDNYQDSSEKDSLAVTFTFLTFFSWLGLIKYCRIFKSLRSFIDMLSAIIKDMLPFLIILMIGYCAVVNAFFFKLLMEEKVP